MTGDTVAMNAGPGRNNADGQDQSRPKTLRKPTMTASVGDCACPLIITTQRQHSTGGNPLAASWTPAGITECSHVRKRPLITGLVQSTQ